MGDLLEDPDVRRAAARLRHEVHRLDELGKVASTEIALWLGRGEGRERWVSESKQEE